MSQENTTRSTDGTLLQKYNIVISNYQQNTRVDSQCAEITFFNNGNANVVINNALTLLPGQPFSINGNVHELDVTNYLISFSGTVGQSQNCVVIRKYYSG